MAIKIGFITGARSEFGVIKKLINNLLSDDRFEVKIYVTGMHLLHKYGDTYKEIESEGIIISKIIPCYSEEDNDKVVDFTNIVSSVYKSLIGEKLDVIYIVGDRLEAYGSALAAHFLKLPIAHFAGGQITDGAVDNIYRYNISNLSDIHFVTNKPAYERLQLSPVINKNNIHLSGSTAIDSIFDYLKHPRSITDISSKLENNKYVVVTFHPVTKRSENIAGIMDLVIDKYVTKKIKVLITYPNNDEGSNSIINIINKWENNPYVVVAKNLGAINYYTAIYHAMLVIGNSSSGIIEVPYFNKFTINIGDRQKGRTKPKSVIDISPDICDINNFIDTFDIKTAKIPEQEFIYGYGGSFEIIKNSLLKFFNQ